MSLYTSIKKRAWARHKHIVVIVRETYGDRCFICGEPVVGDDTHHEKIDGKPRLSLKPSVDHVVPRSLGGGNTLANLRLTHRCCNWIKGNREITPQLRSTCLERVRVLRCG